MGINTLHEHPPNSVDLSKITFGFYLKFVVNYYLWLFYNKQFSLILKLVILFIVLYNIVSKSVDLILFNDRFNLFPSSS